MTLQPWDYVIVPQCILPEYNSSSSGVFPKFFWSTHITGKYATGALSTWLRQLGCDPVVFIKLQPNYVDTNTFGSDPSKWDDRIWTLSDDLITQLYRIPVTNIELASMAPGDIFSSVRSNVVSAILSGSKNASYDVLVKACNSLHPAIDGFKHGLCVWPPVMFKNQEHANAWLAHYESWRYGFDSASGLWKDIPPAPKSDPHLKPRNYYTLEFDPGCMLVNPYRDLFSKALGSWSIATQDEKLRPINGAYGYKKVPFYNMPVDNLTSNIMSLYVLTCVQMSLYMEARKLPGAFPKPPKMQSTACQTDWTTFFTDLGKIASNIATLNVGGMVGTAFQGMIKGIMSGRNVDIQLPWAEQWYPRIVPISQLTDLPICTPASIAPTMMTTGKLAIPSSVLKQVIAKKVEEQKKEFPYLLVGAGALGAYLLLKKKG